ncbi:PAS domain S-box protein [Rhodovarius crocodyli]|uniref:histidine kinase n=1 Tax=Rhodovarius crocodyli TaxID=1979269 RepID=A0A437MIV9_9PROT|nr:PAS domain-containing protein [Rhodovarius crocodyli]RVT97607.1 PAS domain S-box protein [Rhodovarius crocodyli]
MTTAEEAGDSPELRAALAASEARLRRVQRIGLVGGFEIELDSGLNHRSGEYMALHGASAAPVVERHQDWVARLHPEDRESAERVFLQAISLESGVTEYAQEYRVVTPTGDVRWISARAEIERAPDGRAVRVVGAHVDVTRQKEIEAALATSRAELQNQLAQLDLASVMVRDMQGRITFWSQGCERLLGWTAAEAVGRIAWELLATIFPKPFDDIQRILLRDGEWSGDLISRHRDRRALVLATRKVLHRAPDGEPLAVMETFDDVTALRETQAELQALNHSLEQRVAEEVARREAMQARTAHADRMQALGQLAGGMAHDMRNILQMVKSASALIGDVVDEPDQVMALLDALNVAVERGDAVASRLLAFARRSDLSAAAIDAAELLDDLRIVLERTLGRAYACDVAVEPGLPRLMADRRQLEAALVNLAVNARDAMPEGGVVRLSAALDEAPEGGDLKPGRYVRLEVTDNGTGMDEATLARVLEPFFTTKPAEQGTGLGLPMAKGFAEQSGGGLALRSAPGLGTTVMLWLPVA